MGCFLDMRGVFCTRGEEWRTSGPVGPEVLFHVPFVQAIICRCGMPAAKGREMSKRAVPYGNDFFLQHKIFLDI